MITLTDEEVKALVEEFKDHFFSRDNPTAEQVIVRMMKYLLDKEKEQGKKDAGSS